MNDRRYDDKKRIVFVAQFMRKGGAERVISILANYLADLGLEVSLILLYKEPVEYYIDPKIDLIQLDWKRRCSIVTHLRQCQDLRKLLQDSVTIAFLFNSIFYTTISSIGVENRLIFSERNDPSRDPDSIVKRIARDICYLYADNIVFQTSDQMRYFARTIRKKGVIIENPVEKVKKDHDVDCCQRKVISICRLEKQKNVRMAIDAFALFKKSHNEYAFHIFGEGSEKKELLDYIYDNSLSDSVFIHDFTTSISSELDSASIFILSSDYEGISNAMLEAMAMGLPVICTDCPIGGAKAMIKHNINGYLVPTGDYIKMADYMCQLADDASLRKLISSNAKRICEEYATTKIGKKWLDICLV